MTKRNKKFSPISAYKCPKCEALIDYADRSNKKGAYNWGQQMAYVPMGGEVRLTAVYLPHNCS